jgi:hypothetical protein
MQAESDAVRARGVEVALAGLEAAPERACGALSGLAKVLSPGLTDRAGHLRLGHVLRLLKAGELLGAATCLDEVRLSDVSPDRRWLELDRLHHHALAALAEHDGEALFTALKAYEVFLREGTAPDEHLALIAEVAAGAYQYARARPVADSLVLEFLRAVAVPALSERALSSATPAAARAWIVGRLETVAQAGAVDWQAIYATQLEDGSCGARRAAIERLAQLGQLSSAGVLLREAKRGEACTRRAALSAVDELVKGSPTPSREHASAVVMASR